jgi:hypothetical protein
MYPQTGLPENHFFRGDLQGCLLVRLFSVTNWVSHAFGGPAGPPYRAFVKLQV